MTLRNKITAYAISEGICTRCFSKPAKEGGYRQCAPCTERKKVWKKATREKFGSSYNRAYYLKHCEAKKAKSRAYKAKRKSEVTDIEKSVKKYEAL